MILITGAARSGTSLTTQIVQDHGCYLGRRNEVNTLFENTGIRQNVLKPYLKSIGCDPLGQGQLPDTDNLRAVPDLRERVEAYFTAGVTGGPKPWAYKDAKLTLCWTVWDTAFPDAKWIIVRRDAERIAESCIRTSFMRHYGDDFGAWLGWVREHEKRFDQMKRFVNFIEVWPERYIRDPNAFAPVAEFIGKEFKPAAVINSVRRDDWHG